MGQQHTIGRVHTAIFKKDNTTTILYHGTAVVTFNKENIILDSGGWRTFTTKTRMNQASRQYNLGFRVYQKNGVCFVTIRGFSDPFTFEDGMEIAR